MHLQESGEMYLETLLVLSQKSAAVRAIDVGEYMGYSKPSVSRAMGLLREGGFVVVDQNGYLKLTEEGRRVAEKTYERHRVFSEFFISIGVDEKTATDDACKIEHDISDTTFAAFKRYLGKE